MIAIPLPRNIYEHFSICPSDALDEEISRTSIRLKLQEPPKTDEERRKYQQELDRISGLKYLSQLRKGKLTREDFDLKVQLMDV
ncbi:MAG TPA: hypothetical protein VGM63_22715 [Mucilaginibacter sp.]|jgi:hypothetical protein